MADTGWQRKFEDPIPIPNGKKLVTLRISVMVSGNFTR